MEQSLIYQLSCLLGNFFLLCSLHRACEWSTPVWLFVQHDVFLSFLSGCFFTFAGKNCCFNSSIADLFFEFEPHPSSAKNLRHLFQSMPCASSFAVMWSWCEYVLYLEISFSLSCLIKMSRGYQLLRFFLSLLVTFFLYLKNFAVS